MDDAHPSVTGQPGDAAVFEALLWDLFLRLMDLPGDRVEAEIVDAQRRLCRALGLDRSALWQTRPADPSRFYVTHVYTTEHDGEAAVLPDGSIPSEGGPEFRLFDFPLLKRAEASGLFDWVIRRMRDGLTTAIASLDDLPPEAARDRETFHRFGTMSTVLVPLVADGEVLGCLSFATTGHARRWEPELVAKFERLAQVFAKALAKKRAEELLHDREAHLELAAESAEAGLWELDLLTGEVSANEATRRLFAMAPGEPFDLQRALAAIHPDDRQRVLDAIAWGREHGAAYQHECRVQLPDGSVRWIYSRGRLFTPVEGEAADRVIGASIDITERKRTEEKLQGALDELRRLRGQLEQENVYLKSEVRERHMPAQIVGTSAAIRRAVALVDQVAPTAATVLLSGETGTGKERMAAAIHELSPRRARAMITVNCAAIPATLLESELFGREKGAYTGALTRQIGRFELASGSTIFLDEIGDLPLETQGKLLRVIETREFERLGSPNPIHVDVRIIAATNKDLNLAVREGRFREDLYFRLNVFPITLPALRERPEDIPLLAMAIVDELGASMGRQFHAVSQTSLLALQKYHWPGNIRELRNVVERAMITSEGPVLNIELPSTPARRAGSVPLSLRALEREHVEAVLQATGWRVRGPRGAAVTLGLPPTTLENRMKRLGIIRPNKKLP